MIKMIITTTPILFAKFFSPADGEAALEAVCDDAKRVVFLDTGVTPVLAHAIAALHERGVEVHIRDHHRGEGRNPEAAEAIDALLGERARIVTREEAPGCALLVETGEFAGPGTVIVADPDLDGLTTAMKAAGVSYPGMDQDAEVFDVRPRQSAETLTSLGWTVVRALASLPPFNPAGPERSEAAKQELFELFVAAAQGDEEARASLEGRVATYEAGVKEAQRLLAEKVSEPYPRVAICDTVGADRSDLNTLTKGMEEGRGAIVTGIRKDFGPIARNPGGFGVQISISVARRHQKEFDLRDLVPQGLEKGPQAGLLSNNSFLLHCSEKVWEETILPGLKARFA